MREAINEALRWNLSNKKQAKWKDIFTPSRGEDGLWRKWRILERFKRSSGDVNQKFESMYYRLGYKKIIFFKFDIFHKKCLTFY